MKNCIFAKVLSTLRIWPLREASNGLKAKASYSRRIPALLKKQVWERDQGVCQYQDPLTKRKCGSRFRLQYEHRVPVAMGGEAILENIELLCAIHNQWRAIKIFGLEKMRRHFEPLKSKEKT